MKHFRQLLSALAGILFLLAAFSAPHSLRAADGDTIRVGTWVMDEYTWPEAHVQSFPGFPSANQRFRKVIMRYTLDCAAGGCDPWDIGAPVAVDHRWPGGQVQTIEIGRFITPYRKTGIWEWDVTDYQSILRDTVTLRHSNASYTSGPDGYAVSIEFIFIEGTPARFPYKVQPLWEGGYTYGINTVDTTRGIQVALSGGDTVYTPNWQHFIVHDNVITFDSSILGTNNATDAITLGASKPDGRSQFLFTAAQLSAASINMGNISGLRFHVQTPGAPLRNLRLRIRNTALTALSTTAYENSGFTEVYLQNTTLSTGWNSLQFLQPFNYTGGNIILDISYDNTQPGTDNILSAETLSGHGTHCHALDHYLSFGDTNRLSVPAAAFSSLSNAITVSFWQYGDYNTLPTNSSAFEALDAAGNRVLNVHLPWSNGRVYWDAGNQGTNYDRIDQAITPWDFEGKWNHWAFTKDATTGTMKIFLNGQLLHSGTGMTRTMGGITQFRIGCYGNASGGFWDSKVDDFQVWGTALDSASIHDWMHRKISPAHPNYAQLLAYFPMDEGSGNIIGDAVGSHDASHQGQADWQGHNRIDPSLRHPEEAVLTTRPWIVLEQGSYSSHVDSVLADSTPQLYLAATPRYNSFDSTVHDRSVLIDSAASMVKLRIRTSGHGFGGSLNCAEFCQRLHTIQVDGLDRHTWNVWDNKCDLNACFPQGGTWIYDRAGWCPGSFVLDEMFELSPFVSAGQTHTIDYDCQPYTWNNQGSTPTWQMANHLIYYEAPAFTVDASLDEVIAPSQRFEYGRFNPICGRPKVRIQNNGTTPLTSLDIHYHVPGGADSVYQWTGNLGFLGTAEVSLNQVDWVSGANKFEAWVSNPNGQADQYARNDTFRSTFATPIVLPNNFFFHLRTNSAGSETKWQLMDESENVLFNVTPFLASNYNFRDTFNLPRGCYIFRLWDTGEDGLDFFANNDGTGFAKLNNINGTPIHTFPADFGGELKLHFTIDTDVSIAAPVAMQVDLFPNPSTGMLSAEVALGTAEALEIQVYSLEGQRVWSGKWPAAGFHRQVIDLSKQAAGMYMVELKTERESTTRKVVLLAD